MNVVRELKLYNESEFEVLLTKYHHSGTLEAIIPSARQLTEHLRFYVEFSFHLAEQAGYRTAIQFCDYLFQSLGETAKPGDLGIVLIAEAQFYDRLGISMSRDMYAVQAAEEFVRSGRYRAAQTALKLVAA